MMAFENKAAPFFFVTFMQPSKMVQLWVPVSETPAKDPIAPGCRATTLA
jgi:hypothetical protein